MDKRIYNFSAGPAVLPTEVLERARDELLSFRGTGMSVMEFSHRSRHFAGVLDAAEHGIRELLAVPEHYKILFLQGGASMQFSMVPMNFLPPDKTADYIVTGTWGQKAVREAQRCGDVRVVYSTEAEGYRSVPERADLDLSPDAQYVHYTSNETIEGVEFNYDLDAPGLAVVCDASSNILSKRIDVGKYALIYAGAQKNLGPSGVTVVVIHEDMLARAPKGQHSTLDYRLIAENRSMFNTPNTWGIYLISLVCDWLREQGGTKAVELRNREKAAMLYHAIDSSDGFYVGHAKRPARSTMNITFRLSEPSLDERFYTEAARAGFDGLAGHRSVGGIRASIYNAFPLDGVVELTAFMKDFAARNG